MNEDLKQLKTQVEEFKQWKEERERQQLTFPIDIKSKIALHKDMFVATGNYIDSTQIGELGDIYAIEVTLNTGERWWIAAYPSL